MAIISSSFSIVIDYAASQPLINLNRYIDANRPRGLRGMRVISLRGTGVNNAVIQLSKISAAGGVTAVGRVTIDNTFPTLTDQPGIMQSIAACTLVGGTGGDTLRLQGSAADSTRLVIECIAEVGETVVETA